MKKIIYATFCLSLLSFASCKKDFLNRPTVGVQTEENFFKSPGAGFQSVVKCYQIFNDAHGYEKPRLALGNIATDDSDKGGSDAGDNPFIADLAFARAVSSNTLLQNFWAAM